MVQRQSCAGSSISIHAPRVGSDKLAVQYDGQKQWNFYPRSPRGERPAGDRRFLWPEGFLSTLPAWGATYVEIGNCEKCK